MSQLQQIKAHLKAGKSISPLMALNKFGCMRLASRISELRNEPHNLDIHVEMYRSKEYSYAKYKLKTKGK